MGFFSDLKNKITGGAAKVQVSAGPMQRGQAAKVQITATAAANAKVSGVYLMVRAVESCEVKDTDTVNGQTKTETVRGSHVSYQNKVTVAGAQELKEGQAYSWEAVLEIPTSTNPSLSGKIIDHVWEVQAGLDMTGNDPDSGWQRIQVS